MMRLRNTREEAVTEGLIRNELRSDPGYFAKTFVIMLRSGTNCNRKVLPQARTAKRVA
jgi:hypothetical protein